VLVLLCGGLFLYCRAKKDKKQQQFIATPGYNSRSPPPGNDGPIYAKPDFPAPPRSFTDTDEETISTFSGANLKNPEFMHLMQKLREDGSPPSENFYYDIRPQSTTPSTVL